MALAAAAVGFGAWRGQRLGNSLRCNRISYDEGMLVVLLKCPALNKRLMDVVVINQRCPKKQLAVESVELAGSCRRHGRPLYVRRNAQCRIA